MEESSTKKRKNKKCYAGMEFENVCPGIMQRAPAEEPVGPVSCAPREASGRGEEESVGQVGEVNSIKTSR